ncbi:ankyrin repeat domain-containing protein [Sebaldella sp. S0638]|uniref:ankyrin repeat domain-containing protein n=1 Tax=Sebaldella sp. S0638 TaxID=2957809 RepID=UPI0020A097C5|nr:ankyrin repeat domain-containing protein [Sebaldella sp. S0638]MCP1223932.1 ankyrin repeat domain-containing protein [Sebaldella sp. S0638]
MKKILIWILLFNVVIFSNEIDMLKQMDDSKYEENAVNFFLDTIRKKNNLLVINILDMEKNRQARQQTVKEGTYGPEIAPRQFRTQLTVNSRNKLGYTPIIVAIESGNNEMLAELLKRGASVYEKHPVFGRLALHTACYYGNAEAVKILLDHNKNIVNYQSDNDGWTPLDDAVLKGNIQIVKLLIEYGADPRVPNFKDETPIDMATKFGKGEIVKLLRDQDKKLHWN